MRGLCWLLIALAAVSFVCGAALAFRGGSTWLLAPVGYWRGAVGFLLFAIAIRVVGK